jgi:putative membrane protein
MWWLVHEGMGWWMVFGAVWMILFWGAITALVVWGVRALAGRSGRPVGEESTLEIAQRRYARGEITREEFEEIKATLIRG